VLLWDRILSLQFYRVHPFRHRHPCGAVG